MKWLPLACLIAAAMQSAPAAEVSLAGKWRFALDPADEGIAGEWFGKSLEQTIQLPGVLQAQGYGNEIDRHTPWFSSLTDRFWYQRADYKAYAAAGKTQVPFLCQPPRHYLGAAWYQRDLTIPPDEGGKRQVLFLERARWETRVWIDGREAGSCRSLVAPHVHDLGLLGPGTHQLTLRIDNRMLVPYRPDSHAVSDAMGSTWNGVVGRIELQSTPAVWLENVQVWPEIERRAVRIVAKIGNATGKAGSGRISCGAASAEARWDSSGGSAVLDLILPPDTPLWDEFQPSVVRLDVTLESPSGKQGESITTGLRAFTARGGDFLINGRPVFLRGNHDGGGFPLTGHPPMDVASWRRIFGIYKAWGLNHLRFHSWCPPEAAFQAADELGFYLQPEPGMWNPFSKGSEITKMLYEESERMIATYGNHPSFVMLSPSNEPAGRWKEVLPEWVAHFRKLDSRRLYTSGTGWSLIDDPQPVADRVDYLNVHRIGSRLMRGDKGWFGRDYSASAAGVDVPIVTHEAGQWCAYPDFDVIGKFTGFLRPGNYQIFRDSARANGVLDRNKKFVRASGKLQLACYKEEVEAVLRSRGIAGFQLLDVHDYMGQGTALVGLLDPFWEEKGYATAADFRKFCAPTVLLARMNRRVFTSADDFNVPVEAAHYGAKPIHDAVVKWSIRDAAGNELLGGDFDKTDFPVGSGIPVGGVRADLSKLPCPAAYQLVVSLAGVTRNDWNFWLYPDSKPSAVPAAVTVTRDFNECLKSLASGNRVVFQPRPEDIAWDGPPLDRLPLFWNRLMSPGWSRMLGMWVDAKHPALAGFPTADFGDWQWIDAVGRSRTLNLGRLPAALQPIVQPVDDWNRNWKLGLIFEAKVGEGRLLVCAVDLTGDLADRPASRALRDSLVSYAASENFKPAVAVSPGLLAGMLADTRIMAKLKARSETGTAAIDGDPNTFWLAGGPRVPVHPHVLEIHFPKSVPMAGFTVMPRQNHRDHEGDIREFLLEGSDDGRTWRQISRGNLESGFHPQSVTFQSAVSASHLRFTALSGFGKDTSASLAEFAIHYCGPPIDGSRLASPSYQRARSASTDVDEGE